ncbi:hypothetical protein Cni_G13600 [Canna indica]|uniref:Uncharacterized protein n=1 Tax=Canna indica TaxID=4628 RepID=A0AAQ3K9U2_9LILI|nr:hypothetical protein Cni_G13600 [Canna indica]
MGRPANYLAQAINSRPQGALPSSTEKNPMEQCKLITLMSGKEVGIKMDETKDVEEPAKKESSPIKPEREHNESDKR